MKWKFTTIYIPIVAIVCFYAGHPLAEAGGEGDNVVDSTSQLSAEFVHPNLVTDVDVEEEEEAPPGLDQSVIAKVVTSHMPAIRYCYNKELKKDTSLSGTVVTRFTVGSKGSVVQAEIGRSTLNNEKVEKCMVSEIQTWVFPEPRQGVEVVINYPFKFKASS